MIPVGCPNCHAEVLVKRRAGFVRIVCPNCGVTIAAPDDGMLKKKIRDIAKRPHRSLILPFCGGER